MKPTSLPAEVILAVIRGELPLSALEQVGVHVTFSEKPEGDQSCEVKSETPVVVTPHASDIAHGLLTYQANLEELKRWAFFLLATSEVVNLEELESQPEGDILLGGLWDASFEGTVKPELIEIAAILRNAS